MKKATILSLMLISAAIMATAQRSQTLSLRAGDQRTIANGIHISFLEVVEDSRCPIGTTCIWAGNAKVSLALSRGKTKATTMELNSTLDPREIEFGGYRIKFLDLTRRPNKPGQMTMVRPKLMLSITRIKR